MGWYPPEKDKSVIAKWQELHDIDEFIAELTALRDKHPGAYLDLDIEDEGFYAPAPVATIFLLTKETKP